MTICDIEVGASDSQTEDFGYLSCTLENEHRGDFDKFVSILTIFLESNYIANDYSSIT